MPEVIRWEPPPPHGNTGKRRGKPYKYQPIADALRAKPGEWAVAAEGIGTGPAGGLTNRIKAGWTCFAPAGAFEAVCRGPANGTATVYARYVGSGDGGPNV